MVCSMFKRFLLLGLLSLLPLQVMAAEVPNSAEEVSPLLIGATVAESTLHTPEGEALSLQGILAEKSTILVFYRGGW